MMNFGASPRTLTVKLGECLTHAAPAGIGKSSRVAWAKKTLSQTNNKTSKQKLKNNILTDSHCVHQTLLFGTPYSDSMCNKPSMPEIEKFYKLKLKTTENTRENSSAFERKARTGEADRQTCDETVLQACISHNVAPDFTSVFPNLYVWLFCLHVCQCTVEAGRALNTLGLELQMDVSCYVGPGN